MRRLWHRNRCHGDVPPETDALMQASSSASNTSQPTRDGFVLEPKHKIFLSHSGAQKGFVEQLCVDLERCDRHPFFDRRWDSLPKGKEFPPLIFEAIQQCQVGVVIFSEEYFTRTKWPMLEFVAMARRTDKEFTLIPVFLNISRTECRDPSKQSQWIKVWKKWAKNDKRTNIVEWKNALALLGPTNAFVYEDEMSEVKFRGDILKSVCKYVHPEIMWDDSNVEGRERFCMIMRKKVESTCITQNYGVIVVGLYGMGGIGKTTMCKTLCNDYLTELHGRVCHVEFESASKLDLLRRLLLKLTDVKPKFLDTLNEGECCNLLKRNIYKHRVFLAIDNVSDNEEIIKQARTFLKMGFKSSSVVVVTARSLEQLKCLNISDNHCMEMPELKVKEARSLFLSQVGGVLDSISAMDRYCIMQCVEHCCFSKGGRSIQHYHPLALEVLGLQLGSCFGYDPKQWIRRLHKHDSFNQFQNNVHPIFSILRGCFDKLLPEDQLLFMDAALYSLTIVYLEHGMWNIFEWLSIVHGTSVEDVKRRLEGLKRKSLLENLGDGVSRITMHDLWREFAVMETRLWKLKHRRWLFEDYNSGFGEATLPIGSWESLQRIMDKGLRSLLGLDFQRYSSVTVLHVVGKLKQMGVLDLTPLKLLRSLVVDFSCLDFDYDLDSQVDVVGLESLKSLRFLVWDLNGQGEISATCIEEIGSLINLRILVLRVGGGNKLPNLSSLASLQVVSFDGFDGVETISGLSSRLTKLQYLKIWSASSLLSCPGVGDVLGLEVLDLFNCSKLEVLPDLEKLTNLRTLDISDCKSMKLLPGVAGLISLENLNSRNCNELVEFPDMRKLSLLRKLDVWDCPLKALLGLGVLFALQELRGNFQGMENQPNLHKLTKLHKLVINGWSAQGLPCLVSLMSLKDLTIEHCKVVDELVGMQHLTSLQSLKVHYCNFKDMSVLSHLTSLEELKIYYCPMLERLPGLHHLTTLKQLDVDHCGSLQTLGGIGALPQLEDFKCYWLNITAFPDLSSFPRLKDLRLHRCARLLSLTSSGPLTALTSLDVSDCSSLKALPDLSSFPRLKDLRLHRCARLLSLTSSGPLTALTSLDVSFLQ